MRKFRSWLWNASRSPTATRHSPRSCWMDEVCSSRSSSRRKCVLLARRSEQNSARTEIRKTVKGGDYCCQGPMVVISTGASIYQVNASKLRRLVNTVDLEKLQDSRERTGAPVLWLSFEGQKGVWELFSDNSYLSAILDRQGLSVAAPVDLRTKKRESFWPQLSQGFWSKLKKKNPKTVVMYPNVTTKNSKKKANHMATVLFVPGRSRISNPWW